MTQDCIRHHHCSRHCLHSDYIPEHNPFGVTKSEVGLSNVQNYPLTPTADPKASTEVHISKADAYKGHIEA